MKKKLAIALLTYLSSFIIGCNIPANDVIDDKNTITDVLDESIALESEVPDKMNPVFEEDKADSLGTFPDVLPTYTGSPYEVINGNEPFFSEDDRIRTDAFESYSELDELGRCGVAYANICKELQPTEERGSIGHVKPSGWETANYNGYIEGNYLYNRCHLIGYQLAGENANEQNLITGTRYMNCDGQLPFEDMIDDYVDDTGNHVLYRVTPMYEDDNLVASGVLTEAYSVEDSGKGLSFCVYCFNVQPGIGIDYRTGDSWLLDDYTGEYATETYFSTKQIKEYTVRAGSSGAQEFETETTVPSDEECYVLNMNTMKFHKANCPHAQDISEKNRQDVTESKDALLGQGYSPCKSCNP